MARSQTFLLGASDLPLLKEISVPEGMLFKEAAADALFKNRGYHLYLQPSHLPAGVSLLDTLLWLDQEAPRDALLFFPIDALHPSALPKGGPWVPVVQANATPLALYYLLLEIEPLVKGVAIDERCFKENEISLLLDPFTEKRGAFSYLSLPKENYFSEWKKFL